MRQRNYSRKLKDCKRLGTSTAPHWSLTFTLTVPLASLSMAIHSPLLFVAMLFGCGRVKEGFVAHTLFLPGDHRHPVCFDLAAIGLTRYAITALKNVCSTIAGTYVNGRRLPLQGRGWGFESLRAYQSQI